MIYITGSEGFIGSRLKQKINEPVVCIDKKINFDLLNIDWDRFIDINGEPESIIHLAALTDPREANKSIEKYYKNNVEATKKLFLKFPKSKIIYASTSLVEHDLNNFYSMTKFLNEIDAKEHPNALGLRITTVFGDGARNNMIVPRIINNTCEYLSTYKRDFVWVDDLVDLIISLVRSDKTGIMNVSSGNVYEIKSLGNLFGIDVDVYDPLDEPKENMIKNDGLISTMKVDEYIRMCQSTLTKCRIKEKS